MMRSRIQNQKSSPEVVVEPTHHFINNLHQNPCAGREGFGSIQDFMPSFSSRWSKCMNASALSLFTDAALRTHSTIKAVQLVSTQPSSGSATGNGSCVYEQSNLNPRIPSLGQKLREYVEVRWCCPSI